MRTVFIGIAVILVIVIVAGLGLFFLNPGIFTGDGGDGQVAATAAPNSDDDDSQVPLTAAPTNTLIPFTEVVIAVQDIPRGVTIQPNMVAIISFPAESVAFGAFNSLDDVIGKIARTDIVREEHILATKVVDDLTGLGRVGSDAAAILPPNLVAVSLPIDEQTSVSYALQPGDRVDVIVSMLFVDVDPEFQTILPNDISSVGIQGVDVEDEGFGSFQLGYGPEDNGRFDSLDVVPPLVSNIGGQARFSTQQQAFTFLISPIEDQRPRLVTQRTVLDALVVWLGEFPEDGQIFRPAATPTPFDAAEPTPTPATFEDEGGATLNDDDGRPDSVTLAVQPQDAVILTYLAEAGLPLTFALRSAGSTTLQPTEPVTLGFILNRFNVQVPEKFTFAVEPAIRSIRELSLGDRIQLRPDEPTPVPEDGAEGEGEGQGQ